MATIKIGDLLKSYGAIDDRQLHIALMQQHVTGEKIGDTLIKLGFISSMELAQALAEQTGMEFINLNEYIISEEAIKIIPKDIAEKGEFLPLDLEDGRLSIGITNPSNIIAVDLVTQMHKKTPKTYLIDTDSFRDALERAYFFLENPIKERMNNLVNEIRGKESVPGHLISTLTDLIIMDGIKRNATDIHVNPTASVLFIFYRIDGVLQPGHSLPKNAHAGIISRIKILSKLDIAETRLPQDGAFPFSMLNKRYDIRVATSPTIHGENIVMRILAGSEPLLKLERLGFDSLNTERLKTFLQKSYGIILITGPTGSGKTTTLYAALKAVDILERNIITVEDPVEYRLSMIKQTQVNIKAGYDFEKAGKSFMRQDPDVILLGEIRDEETAKIAIRASITGHLVLSTLHTNDAVSAIPRLLDLNVDRFLMSSSLRAILAQRLLRKICLYCKEKYPLNEFEKSALKEAGISLDKGFRGRGCPKCDGIGYIGRTVAGEILIIDDEIREMIDAGASVTAIKAMAVSKGMVTLKDAALGKAAEGITTITDALRVTG